MAYSKALAERIRRRLSRRKNVAEMAMFGGFGFLMNGNMCVGVWKDSLIARVGPEHYEEALKQPFAGEFDITGRAMTGWVMVASDGIADDEELQEWIELAVRFVKTLPAK